MLLDILKLFGLDVRAKIVEARTEFEQRAQLAKTRVTRALTTASVLAALFAMAALAGLAAVGVGLSALYSWVSIYYGQFYGYAAVGGVLVIVSVILGAIGIVEARSWSATPTAPHSNEKLARDANGSESAVPVRTVSAAELEPPEHMIAAPIPPAAPAFSSSWNDGLSEPLGLLLSKFIRPPITGNPVVDDMIAALRGPAHGAVGDAVKSAADVIRYGEREKLIAALGTAVFVGWLLERVRSRQVAER